MTSENEQVNPLEVAKEPLIVKEAQDELPKLDVLVCGQCHEVFHYVEQLQVHKLEGDCAGVSSLRGNRTDQKPQVWGFLLWKTAKFKNAQEEAPSSWGLYQMWCNLDAAEKETWITAGQTIQHFTKLNTSKYQETKTESCQTDKIQIEEEVPRIPRRRGRPRTKIEVDPLGTETDTDSDEDIEKELAEMEGLVRPKKKRRRNKMGDVKKVLKPMQMNSENNITGSKDPATKIALRTVDDKKEECTIEKIISKRYNRGKKMFEYYIKWENFEHEQNTWEPAAHVEQCKLLLEEFDKNLQKQRAQKLAQKQIIARKLEKSRLLEEANLALTTGGRPQRTSKQKALNQVKVWCGNISDADDGSGKRIYSDSDSSDSVEKKIKLEADSSDSDYETPPVSIKRIKQNVLNGTGRKQALPDNVLVPDAQGVIRINQKQLPALSSGVYVMSKTAGIIKLDSNTSKIATSGGHAVIKVAPKIGQTSIKVIKKESATNGSKVSVTNKLKPPARVYSSKIIKKTINPIVRKSDTSSNNRIFDEDDESDGLEELEFPTDLPLPPPDSPVGDFTLDPETGKIAGQEYPPEDPKMDVQDDSTATLENLVELAAAEILDGHEKEKGSPENNVNLEEPTKTTESLTDANQIEPKQPEGKTAKDEAASNTSSILSKALSNANIEANENINTQKKLLNNPNVLKQKAAMNRNILNRTIVPKPQPQAIITRISPGVQRNRPFSKQFSPQMVNRKVIRQTYVNKSSAPRKVTNYQSSETAPEPTILNTTQPLQTTTTAVINMPLLTESDQETVVHLHEESNQNSQQSENADLSTFSLSESESPLLITGEDGTIYQVAGQNEDGQTILITQDADGQQQCLLVASDNTPELNQAVSTTVVESSQTEEPLVASADTEAESSEDSQVVAQIVSAQPPSPGGTRKVVLMLPDGNLMMTEVTAEQYAALELDK